MNKMFTELLRTICRCKHTYSIYKQHLKAAFRNSLQLSCSDSCIKLKTGSNYFKSTDSHICTPLLSIVLHYEGAARFEQRLSTVKMSATWLKGSRTNLSSIQKIFTKPQGKDKKKKAK